MGVGVEADMTVALKRLLDRHCRYSVNKGVQIMCRQISNAGIMWAEGPVLVRSCSTFYVQYAKQTFIRPPLIRTTLGPFSVSFIRFNG